jgi:hypothetical protein
MYTQRLNSITVSNEHELLNLPIDICIEWFDVDAKVFFKQGITQNKWGFEIQTLELTKLELHISFDIDYSELTSSDTALAQEADRRFNMETIELDTEGYEIIVKQDEKGQVNGLSIDFKNKEIVIN